MTNEIFKDKDSVITSYIERKKQIFSSVLLKKCGNLEITNGELVDGDIQPIEKFLSDMAQEILGALPEEKILIKGTREIEEILDIGKEGFNSCRSTFLENIKKLTNKN